MRNVKFEKCQICHLDQLTSKPFNYEELDSKIALLEEQLGILTDQISAYVSSVQQSSTDEVPKKSSVKEMSQSWKLDRTDCWNCGEMGHFRNQCPGKRKSPAREDMSHDVNRSQENPPKLN